jgi:hypothetical protein
MTSTPGSTALDRSIGGMGARRRVERDDHVFRGKGCVYVVKGDGSPGGYIYKLARRNKESQYELTIHGDCIRGGTEIFKHFNLPIPFISNLSQSTKRFLGTSNPPLLFRQSITYLISQHPKKVTY